MTRRNRTTSAPRAPRAPRAPQAPEQPARPRRPPSDWYARIQSSRLDWQIHTFNAYEVGRMSFVLPSYQRGVVWTRAQQLALVRFVWSGEPISPVVVWERSWSEPLVVLDGQQRLTALGVPMMRADGTINDAPRFALDMTAGEWLDADPGDRLVRVATAMEIAGASMFNFVNSFYEVTEDDALYDDLPAARLAAVECYAIARDMRIPVMVLRGRVGHDAIVRAFRALATPGVPWTPEEIERMIASASEVIGG